MRNWFLALSVMGLLLPLGACGDDGSSAECTDDAPAFDEVAAFEKCTTCDSSDLEGNARRGAPAKVNFDTQAAAEANAEEGVEEVEEGKMPPKDSDISLTEDEKQELIDWAACL